MTSCSKRGQPKENENISSKSKTKSKTVQIVSSDHVTFRVDELSAMESCVMNNWIQYGFVGALALKFTSEILLKVIEFSNDEADTSATASNASVDVKSMKVKDKNFPRVLLGKVTEVKFYPTNDMRMVVAGNDCGDLGFWKIDSNEDEHGIYVYHPHPACISGILVQPSSLSKNSITFKRISLVNLSANAPTNPYWIQLFITQDSMADSSSTRNVTWSELTIWTVFDLVFDLDETDSEQNP
ncbi:WD repeat-containing protein 76 [Tanacetum coccineum]